MKEILMEKVVNKICKKQGVFMIKQTKREK